MYHIVMIMAAGCIAYTIIIMHRCKQTYHICNAVGLDILLNKIATSQWGETGNKRKK